jgi:hypothetical protein
MLNFWVECARIVILNLYGENVSDKLSWKRRERITFRLISGRQVVWKSAPESHLVTVFGIRSAKTSGSANFPGY